MIDTKHLKQYLKREFPGVQFSVRNNHRHITISCCGGTYFEELKVRLGQYLQQDRVSVQYHLPDELVSIYWSERPPYPDVYRKATGDVTFVPRPDSRLQDRIIHLECGHSFARTGYRNKLYARPTGRFHCTECSLIQAEQDEAERLKVLKMLGG